jgi:Protein of unknown function (DUF1573)
MKKLFVLTLALAAAFGVMAQSKKSDDVVKFETDVHDFGVIKQGVPVTYNFKFKNISGAPVVVESATASCGCTTPVKPEQPVMPGKENSITAGFNAAAVAPFTKQITIKIAGTEDFKIITIKGEVKDAAAYDEWVKQNPPAPVKPAAVVAPVSKTKKPKVKTATK